MDSGLAVVANNGSGFRGLLLAVNLERTDFARRNVLPVKIFFRGIARLQKVLIATK
jgi:hypothetical protein